jgi:hypothetical protein
LLQQIHARLYPADEELCAADEEQRADDGELRADTMAAFMEGLGEQGWNTDRAFLEDQEVRLLITTSA